MTPEKTEVFDLRAQNDALKERLECVRGIVRDLEDIRLPDLITVLIVGLAIGVLVTNLWWAL